MKYSKIMQGNYLLSKINNMAAEERMDSISGPSCVQFTPKTKRFRSAFTTEQISFLEHQFKKFPYISCEHRKEIASTLDLKERAIKIWFQNRRMKEKKETVNKEIDYETTNKVDGQDILISACTLPANEQLSYSLPVLVNPVNDKKTAHTWHKVLVDIDGVSEVKATITQVSQKRSTETALDSDQNTILNKRTTPLLGNVTQNIHNTREQTGKLKRKTPPTEIKSEFFSSKKCKKQDDQFINVDQNTIIQDSSVSAHAANIKTTPEDLSMHNPHTREIKSHTQAHVGVPYYPVVPSIYAHPYISSAGMIWKPTVSIMPVIPGPNISSNPQPFGTHMKKLCNCNCHENPQVFTAPSNSMNPYSHLMTSPFPCPRF